MTATAKTVANGLFRPEFWAKELLRNLDNSGVMLDCVNRDYEGEIKNAGDTVHIQKAGDVTVSTYSTSTPMNYDALTGETDTLVVDQHKYWGFLVPDIDKVQANVPLAQKYLQRAKKEISNVKDAYLLGLAQAGVASGNQLGTVALTAANIYGTCVALFEKLARANAIDDAGLGEDGKRPFLILPPEVISIVKQSDEAKHATTLGDQTIRKGAIMQFAGFDIKQSTVFPAPTTTTAQTIIAGTTEAITYADQVLKTESIKDKDYFGDYVRGLYVYGALVAQPKCLASAAVTI
jgi:hypothetical protein